MQTNEHQAVLPAQFVKKVQHKADISVLGVKLGFIKQMDHGIGTVGGFQHKTRSGLFKVPDLVRLVVMDGQPVPLTVFDVVDIVAEAQDLAAGGAVAAGNQLEQRCFSGSVGSHHAHDGRLLDGKIGLELKSNPFFQSTLGVDLRDLSTTRRGGCPIFKSPIILIATLRPRPDPGHLHRGQSCR